MVVDETSGGASVVAGAALVSLEAMKIETTAVAPMNGSVHRVLCREGQVVAPGEPLVVLVVDG